jgi:cell wall-associated NlpC family hydrolase
MQKMAAVLCFFLLFSPLWSQELASATPASVPAETEQSASSAATADDNAPELDIEAFLRGRIAETVQLYLGVPYKPAGISPEGFDCSGLVYFVFLEAAGMEVSRSTVGLWKSGKAIRLTDVKPGDLLIFTTVRPGASHVGIVLENTPAGICFAHAASKGSKIGVIISWLNETYYKSRVMGARTFF